MKQKNAILLVVFCLTVLTLHSQEKRGFSLGFEVGSEYVTGDLNPNWNVRQDVGYNGYDYGSTNGTGSSVNSEMSMGFIAIKPEFSFLNNMFSIASGLRYTRMNSVIDHSSSNESGYFFLRDNGTSSISEYYKAKKINEDIDYLGIPLEVTFLPLKYEYFDFYLRVGAEINARFNTSRNIQFVNPDMKSYEAGIVRNVGITSNPFYSSVYSSIGIRFGKGKATKYNFEVLLPSNFLTKNNSSIIIPRYYSGVKLSIQFPLKNTTGAKSDNKQL